MRISVTQHVKAAPEDVFDITCNFDYILPEIDPDVVSVERTSGGVVGKGTKLRETLSGPGMKVVLEAEFTEFDRPNSLDFTFTGKGVKGGGTMRTTPSGDGTNLTFDMFATTSGIGWLFYPFLRWDLPRRETRRLKRLAESIEARKLTVESAAEFNSAFVVE